MTLDQVLADWAERAQIARKLGHRAQADTIEKCLADVRQAAEDTLTWLSEEDAMLQSGKSRPWLRARFPEWQRMGHARHRGRQRQYRQIIVPRDLDVVAIRQAGREAGRKSA